MFLTGSLMINFALTLLISLNQVLLLLFSKRNSRFEYMRELGIKNQTNDKVKTILDIYLSGYMEVLVCTVIAFYQVY